MLLNRSRLRTATSYLYKVDSYDVPSRLASARQNCTDAIGILPKLTPECHEKSCSPRETVQTGDEAETEMEDNLYLGQRGPDIDVEMADEVEQPRLKDILRMIKIGRAHV